MNNSPEFVAINAGMAYCTLSRRTVRRDLLSLVDQKKVQDPTAEWLKANPNVPGASEMWKLVEKPEESEEPPVEDDPSLDELLVIPDPADVGVD